MQNLETLIEPSQSNFKKTVTSALIHLTHCPVYGVPALLAYFHGLPELIAKPLYHLHTRMIDPLLHPIMEYAKHLMTQIGVAEKYARAVAHPLVELPIMVGASLVAGHYLEKGARNAAKFIKEKYLTSPTTLLE